MGDLSFRYLRHRLVDAKLKLTLAEARLAALEEIITKMVLRFCPDLKNNPEAIDREIFQRKEKESVR